MIPAVFVIIFYFALGAIVTAIVNKKKPEGARGRWKKLLVYLIIVFAMLGLIQLGAFKVVAAVIIVAGAFEIAYVGRHDRAALFFAGLVYAVIALLFYGFAQTGKDILFLYVVVLTFDGFSQIVGQLLGKTKLAPGVSPNKTVEGFVGGFVVATATAYFIWDEPGWGAFICLAALAGDLLASAYKRKVGVKDYSDLIPGHGGVLDRFDSLIFAGAATIVTAVFMFLLR